MSPLVPPRYLLDAMAVTGVSNMEYRPLQDPPQGAGRKHRFI